MMKELLTFSEKVNYDYDESDIEHLLNPGKREELS